MNRKLHAGLLLIGLLLLGCQERDRTNPFDPANPETEGMPPLLDARAENGRVSLAWDVDLIEGIVLQRIYRREGEGEEVLITPMGLQAARRAFLDTSVVNGVTYGYRLDLSLRTGAHATTSWDASTPGTAIAWFADSEGGGLGRMSADGRDLVGRTSEGSWFLDIAADTLDGSFWAADYLGGALEEYRADGVPLRRVEMPGARALALDAGGASVYVGSFSAGVVERRDRNGELAWRDPDVGPVDAVHSPRPGEVWVASATGEVRMYRDDRKLFTIDDFVRPVAFATAAGNRIFVLDHDAQEVRAFDYAGFPMGTTGAIFTDPTDIEGDGEGGIWVADAGRGGLVRIDARLVETGTLASPGALGVTWDPEEGVLWVAGEGHIRRFLPDGTKVSDLSVGVRPIKVALYHEGSAR